MRQLDVVARTMRPRASEPQRGRLEAANMNLPLVSLVCRLYLLTYLLTCTKALLRDWTPVFSDTPNPPNLPGQRIAFSDNDIFTYDMDFAVIRSYS